MPRISLAFAFALSLLASAAAQEPACIYDSQAYSVNFQGCFKKVLLVCTGHNSWVASAGCADSGVPSGSPAPGLPDSFQGQLCNAGNYYSPLAEGCIASAYQQCQTNGQWTQPSPIDPASGCP
jgi:hypothetical protein